VFGGRKRDPDGNENNTVQHQHDALHLRQKNFPRLKPRLK